MPVRVRQRRLGSSVASASFGHRSNRGPAARTCPRCARAGDPGGNEFRHRRRGPGGTSFLSGWSFAFGSKFAATSMGMIFSPFFNWTPPSTHSTKRGLVNWTADTKRRNSSTDWSMRLLSCSSQSRHWGASRSSRTEPLMRCVVVSRPANSSGNSVDTISSRLMAPPPSRSGQARRSRRCRYHCGRRPGVPACSASW